MVLADFALLSFGLVNKVVSNLVLFARDLLSSHVGPVVFKALACSLGGAPDNR